MARLSRERPHLLTRVLSQSQDLYSSLLDGRDNLVVGMFYNEIPKAGLAREWLFDDQLVVITRPDHPLTRLRKVTALDLQKCTWVVAESDTRHRRRLEQYFEEAGLDLPHAAVECSLPSILKRVVMQTDYVALIARMGVDADVKNNLLQVIEINSPFMARPIALVWRENEILTPAVKSFIQILKEVCHARTAVRSASGR